MTANDVFELGLSWISEKVGEDQDNTWFTPLALTTILRECLDVENAYRISKGIEPLESAPVMTAADMGEPFPYLNEKLVKIAIPYALASKYFRDNNDQYHEQFFFQLYAQVLVEGGPVVYDTIKDVY